MVDEESDAPNFQEALEYALDRIGEQAKATTLDDVDVPIPIKTGEASTELPRLQPEFSVPRRLFVFDGEDKLVGTGCVTEDGWVLARVHVAPTSTLTVRMHSLEAMDDEWFKAAGMPTHRVVVLDEEGQQARVCLRCADLIELDAAPVCACGSQLTELMHAMAGERFLELVEKEVPPQPLELTVFRRVVALHAAARRRRASAVQDWLDARTGDPRRRTRAIEQVDEAGRMLISIDDELQHASKALLAFFAKGVDA